MRNTFVAVSIVVFISASSVRAQTVPAWDADAHTPNVALFAPGVISTGDDDAHVTFDPDGRRVYFLKDSPDFSHWTIAVVEWTGNAWGTPRVAPFSGRWAEGDLSFAPDGRTAFFISTRPPNAAAVNKEDTDIWRLRKKANGEWGEPEHVPELASDGFEWFPNMTADGWLYFGSARAEGNLGRPGTSDLWRARLDGDRFTPPENLGPLFNTMGQDIEPWISPDGRMLIFASNGRKDTRGAYDLYVSHRCGERWTEPRNLGSDVNSPAWDFGPRLSPDGRALFFTSNRALTPRPLDRPLSYEELVRQIRAPGNGLRDVYRVAVDKLELTSPCANSENRSTMNAPSFPIVELRQYTLHPGQRDVLIELFQREFVEPQEVLGMKVIGTFRDLERPDRFVWLRGFKDMPSRGEQLAAFYGGPVWRAHRDAANATMIDSDNVLLLHAPDAESELPVERARGLVVANIYYFAKPVGEEFIEFFRSVVEPELQRAGIAVRGVYVTETSPNNFPRLPVRENENVFVWFTSFTDPADHQRSQTALAQSKGWQAVAPLLERKLERQPEVLLLQPTE